MLAGRVITGVVDNMGDEKDEYFEDDDSDDEPEDGSGAMGDNDYIGAKDPTAGMLADDLDRSARELGRVMAASAKEAEGAAIAAAAAASNSGSSLSDEKVGAVVSAAASSSKAATSSERKSEDEPAAKRSRVSFGSSVVPESATTTTAVSTVASSRVTTEVELSEESVRQYFASMGGKAGVNAVKEVRDAI